MCVWERKARRRRISTLTTRRLLVLCSFPQILEDMRIRKIALLSQRSKDFGQSVEGREKYREVPPDGIRHVFTEMSDGFPTLVPNQKIARAQASSSNIVTLVLLSN